MPINQETLNRRLFKVLHQRFKNTASLDSAGQKTPVEDDADVFKFTFTKDGEEYGDVFVTIDDSQRLKIYYGDDVTDSPGAPTPGVGYDDSWYGLLAFLKSWAMQNQLGWDVENKDHLSGDMARRDHMKKQDTIAEGYHSMGKKASYSDAVPTVKMIIQHNREIQEGEQRYRNVARIFLENSQGERILAPTTKPGVASIYARHLAEGGLPHDERWAHINSMCEEYNKMGAFVRATRNGQFNESALSLVTEGINHYNKLRESLSKMRGHRGYNMYFESWSPSLMEDDSDTSNINELFVQETLDPRIESVMPILSKLHKTVAEMKEVDALSEWADELAEGDGGQEALNPIGIPESIDSELPQDALDLIDEYIAKIEPGADRDDIIQSIIDGHIHTSELEYALHENLDANQKRVGQLGPTEKVRNNNIGKLVGANENFINTDAQAVVSEEDMNQNRTWKMITDYEKRAKETKNDIKKEHYMKMAKELRNKLPTSDLAEGAVKELAMDLKSLSDEEFNATYKMTKAEARAGLKDKSPAKEKVEEGATDTVYPNAEVIKGKNGKPVGEIYHDESGWGCFHYKADRGADMLASREDAIQELKDIHAERPGQPDYTIKGMVEGQDDLDTIRRLVGK